MAAGQELRLEPLDTSRAEGSWPWKAVPAGLAGLLGCVCVCAVLAVFLAVSGLPASISNMLVVARTGSLGETGRIILLYGSLICLQLCVPYLALRNMRATYGLDSFYWSLVLTSLSILVVLTAQWWVHFGSSLGWFVAGQIQALLNTDPAGTWFTSSVAAVVVPVCGILGISLFITLPVAYCAFHVARGTGMLVERVAVPERLRC